MRAFFMWRAFVASLLVSLVGGAEGLQLVSDRQSGPSLDSTAADGVHLFMAGQQTKAFNDETKKWVGDDVKVKTFAIANPPFNNGQESAPWQQGCHSKAFEAEEDPEKKKEITKSTEDKACGQGAKKTKAECDLSKCVWSLRESRQKQEGFGDLPFGDPKLYNAAVFGLANVETLTEVMALPEVKAAMQSLKLPEDITKPVYSSFVPNKLRDEVKKWAEGAQGSVTTLSPAGIASLKAVVEYIDHVLSHPKEAEESVDAWVKHLTDPTKSGHIIADFPKYTNKAVLLNKIFNMPEADLKKLETYEWKEWNAKKKEDKTLKTDRAAEWIGKSFSPITPGGGATSDPVNLALAMTGEEKCVGDACAAVLRKLINAVKSKDVSGLTVFSHAVLDLEPDDGMAWALLEVFHQLKYKKSVNVLCQVHPSENSGPEMKTYLETTVTPPATVFQDPHSLNVDQVAKVFKDVL